VRCEGLYEAVPFRLRQTDDADAETAAFHATPFDPKGPRLAVLLLRAPDHDEVCVRFDHVAGDGWSAKEVTHLLAETYSALLADPSYSPAPRLAPRPGHAEVWSALTDEQRAAAAKGPKMAYSRWRFASRRGSGDRFLVRSVTLPADRVAAVRAYARERGATVNEMLLAAMVRSSASMSPQRPGQPAGVSVSADPRRVVQGADLDRVAMLATTQTVLVPHRAGESFEETLRSVREGTRPFRDTLWGVAAANGPAPSLRTMRAFFAFLTAMMRVVGVAGLISMNVGPFDEQRLAFGRLRPVSAVATGPIGRFPGFPALISSYRDAYTLWIPFRERLIADEYVERYLAGIERELAEVAREAEGVTPAVSASETGGTA
jgi:NRPS condensation-like uncharacterized protein